MAGAKKSSGDGVAKKAAAKQAVVKKDTAKKPTAKKASGTKDAVKQDASKTKPAKTTPAKTASAKTASAKTNSAKTASAKTTSAKKNPVKASAKKAASRTTVSLKPEGKDPKGGLTAAGRKQYNEATGGHLRPGVKHPAKTVEDKQRKGSFLRRHFANPPGPVVKDGKPTRQALQAAAWGEPVPKNEADERKLAEKGSKLLDEARAAKK